VQVTCKKANGKGEAARGIAAREKHAVQIFLLPLAAIPLVAELKYLLK